MNLSRKCITLILTAVVITTAWPATAFADEDLSVYSDAQLIAMTMREYQARYHYLHTAGRITGVAYVSWPGIACGDMQTAPAFPPDEYYMDQVEQTNGARDLVRGIAYEFWKVSKIYNRFVRDEFRPGLDGVNNDIVNYFAGSRAEYNYDSQDAQAGGIFPDMDTVSPFYYEDITEENCRGKLEIIYRYITERLVTISANCSVEGAESGAGNYQRRFGEDPFDCADAESEADTEWNPDGWDGHPGYSYGYGVIEWGWDGEGAASVMKAAKRGKLTCDLRYYATPADAKSYVWLSLDGMDAWHDEMHLDGFSNTEQDGFKATTIRWQEWGSPVLGIDWESSHFADFCPVLTGCMYYEDWYFGWFLKNQAVFVTPTFDTTPAGWEEDAIDDPTIYKDPEDGDYVVYSVNPDCDQAAEGETVDGVVYPKIADADATMVRLLSPLPPEAARLTVWGATPESSPPPRKSYVLSDDNPYVCISNPGITTSEGLKFSVTGLRGETDVKFKVIFWRETGAQGSETIYHSEKTVELTVKPNSGSPCCRASDEDDGEGPCQLAHIVAGYAQETIECGDQPEPETESMVAKVHDNGDVEIQLPGYEEPYIMKTPGPGFMSGITVDVTEVGDEVTEVVITDSAAGRQYHYTIPSGDTELRLTSISDCASTPNTLVTFEYDANGRITYQKDGNNPTTHYIQYTYNGTSGYLESLVAETPEGSQTFNVSTDGNGRVTRVEGGGGGGGGCSECAVSDYIYSFNSDGKISQIKIEDDDVPPGEIVLYEYTYDSNGDFTGKTLGPASSGSPLRTVESRTVGDSEIVDTYTYSDTSTTQVEREYRNSAGLVTERETFANTGEDPDNPTGEVFTEITLYEYDSGTNTLVQKTTVPPLGDVSGNGLRREYDYDEDTGALEEERWYDSAGNEIIVRTLTCDNYPPTGDVVHVRVATETDARGAETEYYYVTASPLLDYKLMQQVTGGLTGIKQLKYGYTYDTQSRVTSEETYDYSDSQNPVLLKTQDYTYVDGNLDDLTVTDNVNSITLTTRYLYNGFNQQILMKSPEGVVSGRAYDSSGRLVSEFVLEDPSDIDFDSFDYTTDYEDMITDATPANRFSLFSQTLYYYGTTAEERGRLQYVKRVKEDSTFYYVLATDTYSNVVTEYEYDQYGRRTAVIGDQTDAALETTYEYDYQDRVKKTTLPNGKWTETHRDGRGMVRMQIVGHDNMDENDWLVTLFYYDARGNLSEKVAPDGVSTMYKYDDFDRMVMVRKGL